MLAKKGAFPLIDFFSGLALLFILSAYLYIMSFSNIGDFLGDNERIDSITAPHSQDYIFAMLSSPVEDSNSVIDYILKEKDSGNYTALQKFFERHLNEDGVYWTVKFSFEEDDIIEFSRQNWISERMFKTNAEFFVPNYYDQSLIKVNFLKGKGISQTQYDYERPPGYALRGVV